MTFAQVASVTETPFGSDATDHNVAMPATVDAGDLLVMLFANDSGATQTTPSGWTAKFLNQQNAGLNITFSCFVIDALGTEGGTTVNVVTSASERAAAQVYRITNWFGELTGVEVGTSASGASVSPNSPSLTPSWGALDTLWLACFGLDHNDTRVTSAYPTDYTNGVQTSSSAGAGAASVSSARRELNAVSDDPAVFTIDVSDDWVAQTIAIRPASGGKPMYAYAQQ